VRAIAGFLIKLAMSVYAVVGLLPHPTQIPAALRDVWSGKAEREAAE